MARRRKNPTKVMACRRGCGACLVTLTRPIHGSLADYDRLHGICDDCLTEDERQYMAGPMLMQAAARLAGRAK